VLDPACAGTPAARGPGGAMARIAPPQLLPARTSFHNRTAAAPRLEVGAAVPHARRIVAGTRVSRPAACRGAVDRGAPAGGTGGDPARPDSDQKRQLIGRSCPNPGRELANL